MMADSEQKKQAQQKNINNESCKAGFAQWIGLAVLALPTILLGLDVTLLYLALPALSVDLKPSSNEALWIMDAYGFMIAGFLVTMGSLGDQIGRRKLLMIGAVAFGAASVLAAYSTSTYMLIFARAMLGIAGATLMPSTLALISNIFPDARERALAIGIWASMFALGMAVGPLVGGILLSYFWWGSAFLVAIPIVTLVVIAAPFVLPEYRAPDNNKLDIVSVFLFLTAILPIIFFIKESTKTGISYEILAVLIVGIISATGFIKRQRMLVNPLLDISLFVNSHFSLALSILLVGLFGVGGAMFLVTQYLQLVTGLSVVEAGFWMGAPALMMLVAGIGAPLLAHYMRPGYVMANALGASAIGYIFLAMLFFIARTELLLIGYGLIYLGLGTIAALGTDLVVKTAPPEKAGSASAMSETVQELGIAVGVAVIGSMSTVVYRHVMTEQTAYVNLPNHITSKIEDSFWAASAMANIIPAELLNTAKLAFITGMSISTVITAIIILVLAILCAVALRHIPAINSEK